MPKDLVTRLKPTQLRLLLKIAETGQLQLAANMTGMSQPAASRTLAEIEAMASGPLFQRHPKGMEPTALGTTFVRHGKVIMEALEELAVEARQLSVGASGHVRIGAVSGPAVGSVVPAVRKIKSDFPDLEFTIEVGPSTELIRGLTENRFDFVVSRLPPEYDSRDYRIYPARREEVALLVHPAHPLARREGIQLAETTEFDWVIQELGSPIRQAVEAAFLEEGLSTPAKVINSSSLLIALSLLDDPSVVAPLSQEVATMLAQSALHANLEILNLASPILVSPCFVIENRYRAQNKAAERVMTDLFSRL
jgi:DNA-binding transcriptional LysR family regulator